MRVSWKAFMPWILAGSLLVSTPPTTAQKQPAPTTPPPQRVQAPTSQPPGDQVVIVEPVRVFDPFFDYPYPYAYEPDYMAAGTSKSRLSIRMLRFMWMAALPTGSRRPKNSRFDPVPTISSCATPTVAACFARKWRYLLARQPS